MPKTTGDYFGRALITASSSFAFWFAIIAGAASIAAVVANPSVPAWVVSFILVFLIVLSCVIVILARAYRHGLATAVRDNNALQTAFQEMTIDPVHLHKAIAAGFGIVKERYSVVSEVYPDGSTKALIDQTVRAFHPEIHNIEYQYSIPTHTQNIGNKITMTEEVSAGGHAVTVIAIREEPRTKYFAISFDPPIKKDETITFALRRKSPPGTFAMTPADLGTGRGFEYSAHRLSYPTSHLHARIIFPKGFRADNITAEAWFGLSALTHSAETARLMTDGCLKYRADQSQLIVDLNVSYPIHGLYYAIKWFPIGIQSVETTASAVSGVTQNDQHPQR